MTDVQVGILEFHIVDLPKDGKIPAGTIGVIPSERKPDEFQDREYPTSTIPAKTLLLAGQNLSREYYPEISNIFPGGFYTFDLPDLQGKILMGFDEEGNPIMGDGIIYYESIPPKEQPPARDIRQAL